MRKLLLESMLFFLCGGLASAQQNPRLEIFGGYSIEHVSACGTSSDVFLTCSQFIETGYSHPANYNGWNASVTAFPSKFIGITADFAGNYGMTVIQGNGLPSLPTRRYSFMGGPVAALRTRTLTPFIHALFGGTYNKFAQTMEGEDVIDAPSYTKFTWAIGGGIDQDIFRHLAIRWGQFDFERVGVPAAVESYPAVNGFRFSAGVVFRP